MVLDLVFVCVCVCFFVGVCVCVCVCVCTYVDMCAQCVVVFVQDALCIHNILHDQVVLYGAGCWSDVVCGEVRCMLCGVSGVL